MNVVLQLEPAQFDFFTKIFSKISANTSFEPLAIKNSTIARDLSDNSIVYANFTNLFGKDDVNMNILDHVKASKIFKSVATDDKVTIVEDNDRYLITYGITGAGNKKYTFTFTIHKSNEEPSTPTIEDYSNNILDSIELDKDIFNSIKKLSKSFSTDEVNFLLDEDKKIKAVSVGDDAVIKFDESTNLTTNNAPHVLKSTSFLIFDAEDVKLEIAEKDGKYVGIYSLEFGYPIEFKIYETLPDVNDELDL